MEYRYSDKIKDVRPSAIREMFKDIAPGTISFSAGNPSPLSFPAKEFAELSQELFKNLSSLQYGITEGYKPLREFLANRLKTKFGIGGDGDTTIITSGGQQGIDLTCKVLCNEGDCVLCENPSFIGALNSFRASGVNPVGIEMDDEGIRADLLEKAIEENPRARLIYLIPTYQNPSGNTMSISRRREVLDIARRHGIPILEDNPYGELAYSGGIMPTLKSMDEGETVIYTSSLSKILSAGMRVGYLVGESSLIEKIVVAKQCNDVHTNLFFQMLSYEYMTRCDFEGHIADICKLYSAKCDLMLSSLNQYMPDFVEYSRPRGGLFIWCTLPENIDSGEYIRAAKQRGVLVVPGSTFNCDLSAPSRSFRLNFSMPSDEEIVRGVKILGEVAKELNK